MISPEITLEKLSFSQAAAVVGGELTGEDHSFSQISINSRTLQAGELFIAIKGEQFDGHEFIEQAEEKGAAGLVVDHKVESILTQIIVVDTRQALGQIALLWRKKYALPTVAVTGSCGKTTVKEMLAEILNNGINTAGEVLATRGNLNNDIGVPLTLFRLAKQHCAAVLELGANHRGEIDYLVKLVQPDVVILTNAAHAHIEGFGSLEAVAEAKAEIFSGLGEQGTAIINVDDHFASYWLNYCQKLPVKINIVTFGLKNKADVTADYQLLQQGISLMVKSCAGTIDIQLKLVGLHNIYNALAAVAAATALGVSLTAVKAGLEHFTNVSGRLEQKQGIHQSRILDDTYNANPESVTAGIAAIRQINGNHILVLGDMAELGEQTSELHYQLGIDAAKMGIKYLYAVGKYSKHVCDAFGRHSNEKAFSYDNKDALIDDLRLRLNSNSVVLVKGSRIMAMETIVKAITEISDTLESEENIKLKAGLN